MRRRFWDGFAFGVGVERVQARGERCGGGAGTDSVVVGVFLLRRGLRCVLCEGGIGAVWRIVGLAGRRGLSLVMEAYVGVAGGEVGLVDGWKCTFLGTLRGGASGEREVVGGSELGLAVASNDGNTFDLA